MTESNQEEESINDSSLFCMIGLGSLLEHFNQEHLDDEPYEFILADESIEEPQQSIRNTFSLML